MTDPVGAALLRLAAAGDEQRLEHLEARVRAGEPAAYAAGFLVFAGRRFRSDPRAFITDPETVLLVDAVIDEGTRMQALLERPLRVVEFGVGGGALAISVKLARPDWSLCGLDIDPAALQLAAENAALHGVHVDLLTSDLFSAWEGAPPDIVFGDPPWGGAGDLYDEDRDEAYYRQMPTASAFPAGDSPTAIHDALIADLLRRCWPSLLWLNYGVLPETTILRSAQGLAECRIVEAGAGLRLLRGRAVATSGDAPPRAGMGAENFG